MFISRFPICSLKTHLLSGGLLRQDPCLINLKVHYIDNKQ